MLQSTSFAKKELILLTAVFEVLRFWGKDIYDEIKRSSRENFIYLVFKDTLMTEIRRLMSTNRQLKHNLTHYQDTSSISRKKGTEGKETNWKVAPLESKKCLIFDTFKLSQERSIDWRSKFEKSSREKAFSKSGERGQSRTSFKWFRSLERENIQLRRGAGKLKMKIKKMLFLEDKEVNEEG